MSIYSVISLKDLCLENDTNNKYGREGLYGDIVGRMFNLIFQAEYAIWMFMRAYQMNKRRNKKKESKRQRNNQKKRIKRGIQNF